MRKASCFDPSSVRVLAWYWAIVPVFMRSIQGAEWCEDGTRWDKWDEWDEWDEWDGGVGCGVGCGVVPNCGSAFTEIAPLPARGLPKTHESLRVVCNDSNGVVPAKAGIQKSKLFNPQGLLGSRLRGKDTK
jgi:hypothetical protein